MAQHKATLSLEDSGIDHKKRRHGQPAIFYFLKLCLLELVLRLAPPQAQGVPDVVPAPELQSSRAQEEQGPEGQGQQANLVQRQPLLTAAAAAAAASPATAYFNRVERGLAYFNKIVLGLGKIYIKNTLHRHTKIY